MNVAVTLGGLVDSIPRTIARKLLYRISKVRLQPGRMYLLVNIRIRKECIDH